MHKYQITKDRFRFLIDLTKISEKNRPAIEMVLVDGLSYNEIERRYGIKKQQMYSYVRRLAQLEKLYFSVSDQQLNTLQRINRRSTKTTPFEEAH
jgi:predicted DNA-binding protein YlxM (UPF0122 family)